MQEAKKALTDIKSLNGTLLVRASGELDIHTSMTFRSRVEQEVQSNNCRRLIISLRDVTFIDSSGLGALLGRYRKMTELGGKMALVSIPARLKPVLELSGVLRILPVFDTEKRALERL